MCHWVGCISSDGWKSRIPKKIKKAVLGFEPRPLHYKVDCIPCVDWKNRTPQKNLKTVLGFEPGSLLYQASVHTTRPRKHRRFW